jgi:hypothetical protein
MRRPIRSTQSDLFAAPATAPLSLPGTTRAELVSLLGALLLEVMCHQQPKLITAEKESDHE